jgi:hypothetical protein
MPQRSLHCWSWNASPEWPAYLKRKFEFVPDKKFNDQIVQLLGHKDFYAMPAGEWLLAVEQAAQISELIGYSLPTELKLYIGVEA